MIKFRLIVTYKLIVGALVLSACGAAEPNLTPTVTIDPNQVRTQAVSTFSADLTLTAMVAPTDTPTATSAPLATFTPLATSTGGVAFGSTALVPVAGATASCYGLTFVSDVSIPDNTPVEPGKKFTKTWKVQNSGSCAWDAGFKFANVSGDPMGGQTYALPSSVASGATTDISVSMTAPDKSGTLRGDWRMSTASGQFFGDQVYVQVVIGGGGGAAATNTGAPATTAVATTPAATQTP